MEFDTFGFWVDTEATYLTSVIKDYDEGVHALSHAILAVAPLFVPSGGSDLNCDHNTYDCTRVMIFDNRAGGSGNCAQLFNHLFVPDGLLEAAIDLMETCSQCRGDWKYDGGCPACLHFGQCLKFNQDLNRTAAIHIGKRMLKRIQSTELYKKNARRLEEESEDLERDSNKDTQVPLSPDRKRKASSFSSPRRDARAKALRNAMEVKPTKEREVVLGRPSWPMDAQNGQGGRQVGAD
jgi:DEAD/DEAH box helicase domain-containing protein